MVTAVFGVELLNSRQPSSHSINQAATRTLNYGEPCSPSRAPLPWQPIPTDHWAYIITSHLKRSASADEYIDHSGCVHYACSLHYDGGWAAETPPIRMTRQNHGGQEKIIKQGNAQSNASRVSQVSASSANENVARPAMVGRNNTAQCTATYCNARERQGDGDNMRVTFVDNDEVQ